jgi:hypothetical protein
MVGRSKVGKRPVWSRPLPQTLVIPTVITLRTLADVRKLLGHLPRATREKSTWLYVADRLNEAARGAPVTDVALPLRMVLSMEGIACRRK